MNHVRPAASGSVVHYYTAASVVFLPERRCSSRNFAKFQSSPVVLSDCNSLSSPPPSQLHNGRVYWVVPLQTGSGVCRVNGCSGWSRSAGGGLRQSEDPRQGPWRRVGVLWYACVA